MELPFDVKELKGSIRKLKKDPLLLLKTIATWRDLSHQYTQLHDVAVDHWLKLQQVTTVLVAWSDQNRMARIDPGPLLEYTDAIFMIPFLRSLIVHGPIVTVPEGELKRSTAQAEAEADRIHRRAESVLKRLEIAAAVRGGTNYVGNPPMSDTAVRIARFITENPGCAGKDIAARLGYEPDTVRKAISSQLSSHGFRNVSGKGYFPPG